MKTLYLDCGMGAAGDMLAAALLELIPDGDDLLEQVNALGIPGVHVRREKDVKCGITGTHVSVTVDGVEEESIDHHGHSHGHIHREHGHVLEERIHEEDENHFEGDTCHHECYHDHEDIEEHHHDGHKYSDAEIHNHDAHHHSSLHNIEHIVRSHLDLPQKVQDDIMAVYQLIAEAESQAHGVPVTEIHFHEVGTMDAIADIAMVCMLMSRISPDEVVVSPVHVGSGQVRCAHGILPVPAPATAHILKDVPIYGGNIRGELCTPTGAALLKHFATRFGSMPVMRTSAIGYGMGKKDFDAANCVRAILGQTQDKTDQVLELSCNVDDMTAEQIGFAMEQFFEGGALDVYTVSVGMKKNRPGTLIRIVCREQDREELLALIFRHTTTIGVREAKMQRYVLDRKVEEAETPLGRIRCKDSAGYGVKRRKYEYDDISSIAREKEMSLDQVRTLLDKYLHQD